MDTLNLLAQVGGAAGLTLLLVHYVVKPIVKDGKWWPVASIGVGVVIFLAAGVATGQTSSVALAAASLQGLVSGLVASGVWSGANAMQGK